MSNILEITGYDVYVSDAGVHCEFRAIVEDSVVVAPATRWEPEQWGAAECVGSVLLADDELPPGEDNELEQLTLADSVDNWELPEPTDHEMMSANHLCPAWHDAL